MVSYESPDSLLSNELWQLALLQEIGEWQSQMQNVPGLGQHHSESQKNTQSLMWSKMY